ncbi:type-4 uracil-DNA glycosylase [Sulfolobus acidocaldarius]|uniref:Type-4 uracil-DNA glycosylase n=4 Tax=Sulfolobus acidocaldarius TaxID=2285 RepID=Q4JC99_SULAC|nr:type-4 uracil-DNA glycosylase [Sulfolobus acidocaldarius]AAY79580.1 uracil DNA glycosylase superfamily protein [Sulfolobus acidocaldarius DSM 639]AGE70133.1 uracil DNA glycosylase superfamily protein [Sulfolobus acidocaldarius N8]AGE72408.1 uracil DNA glycosylase superfamily protein [Sulfolobus acidocaldarius Ron12/I]ALU29454.1 DNA polymerase [Sulfolobus acidocaldarius]ALU32183.1 DNA polymerase [Sulfolobus acidocaldarius]
MELDEIANEIKVCRKCKLWMDRRNAVPGEGNPKAKVMFIGEAPGETEDEEGRPFVGSAGKLLTKLIEDTLGIKRDEVFITNVVKCRPPNNRDPEEDEITACSSYLDLQIRLIKPQVIVTLGRHSTSYILSKANIEFHSITKSRGKVYEWKIDDHVINIFPTYHPAAALYNPNLRSVLEEDFKMIRKLINVSKDSKRYTIEFFLGGEDRSRNKR